MQINQGFAASGRGYVRAVFSRRMRGYALPLDLVRVHLRARLREAFAGYLVTEQEALPVWRVDGRVVLIVATQERCQILRYGVDDFGKCGASMDAPRFLPAGSTERREQSGVIVAVATTVLRAGWYE